ncbi:hypothetical protein DFH09DRAFT_1098078 [Mycena vulgaris]|nr:hypothetical protein DFH09DRAFT_1098078 [Mycena vulgaris]
MYTKIPPSRERRTPALRRAPKSRPQNHENSRCAAMDFSLRSVLSGKTSSFDTTYHRPPSADSRPSRPSKFSRFSTRCIDVPSSRPSNSRNSRFAAMGTSASFHRHPNSAISRTPDSPHHLPSSREHPSPAFPAIHTAQITKIQLLGRQLSTRRIAVPRALSTCGKIERVVQGGQRSYIHNYFFAARLSSFDTPHRLPASLYLKPRPPTPPALCIRFVDRPPNDRRNQTQRTAERNHENLRCAAANSRDDCPTPNSRHEVSNLRERAIYHPRTASSPAPRGLQILETPLRGLKYANFPHVPAPFNSFFRCAARQSGAFTLGRFIEINMSLSLVVERAGGQSAAFEQPLDRRENGLSNAQNPAFFPVTPRALFAIRDPCAR